MHLPNLKNLLHQEKNDQKQNQLEPNLSPNLFSTSLTSTYTFGVPVTPKQTSNFFQIAIILINILFVVVVVLNWYINTKLEKALVLSNNYTIALSQKRDVEQRLHQLIRRINIYKQETGDMQSSIDGRLSPVVGSLVDSIVLKSMIVERGTDNRITSQVSIESQDTLAVILFISKVLEHTSVEEVIVLTADRDVVDQNYAVLLQVNFNL